MIGILKRCVAVQLGRMRPGSFGRNVMLMLTGTSLGQLGSVIASPVLTRLYTPEAFGVLGAVTGMLTLLAVVAALGYNFALPLARSEQEAAGLLALCAIALVTTTLACVAFVVALPSVMLDWMLGVLFPFRAFLPIGLFCLGAANIAAMFGMYCRAYGTLARIVLYRGLIGPLCQIALGLAGAQAMGLVVGFILGQSSGTGMAYLRLVWARRAGMGTLSWDVIAALARRYSRFPLFSSWGSLIQVAGTNQMLMLVLPFLFSSKVAGLVFLSDRIVGRPLTMISSSILMAYTGEVSKVLTSNPAELRRRFLQIISRQFVIAGSWILLANLAAPLVFPRLFGSEWSESVVFMHILSLAYLPQMVTLAVGHTLQILERQRLLAAWSLGRLALVAGGFWISHHFGLTARQAVLIYSVSQVAAEVVNLSLMFRSIELIQK